MWQQKPGMVYQLKCSTVSASSSVYCIHCYFLFVATLLQRKLRVFDVTEALSAKMHHLWLLACCNFDTCRSILISFGRLLILTLNTN